MTQSASAPRDIEADRARLRHIHATMVSGDIASAALLAEAALADGIEHPIILSLAAGRLEQAGRDADALVLLQRAKALAPQAPGIVNSVGLSLQRLGRMDDALREFDAALAIDPQFAPAHANRGMALMALARLIPARQSFSAALTLDPANLVALAGLASLAIRRGDSTEARSYARQVLAREPHYPSALLVLAEADLADGAYPEALAHLDVLGHQPADAVDRAIALGLRGDVRDAMKDHVAAFAGWTASADAFRTLYAPDYEAGPRTTAHVARLARQLSTMRHIQTGGGDEASPVRCHAFLIGFPRSGTTLLEQVLEQHDAVATLAEKECLADSAQQALGDDMRFQRFCTTNSALLQPMRDAYWRRVREEGIDLRAPVFVDKHPFHSFKVPHITKLFPNAVLLIAMRDPRDTLLSCFRRRFAMSAPTYEFLDVVRTAQLYDASMKLADESFKSFDRQPTLVRLEDMVADFEATTRRVCDALGIAWQAELADFAPASAQRGVFTPSAPQLARGLNAEGIGKWCDYAEQLAPAMPFLARWIERFDYEQ